MNSESLAVQNVLSGRSERSGKWKSLLKSDPHRVVRALTLTGFSAESIDGDTPWDAQHILRELEDVSKNAKGEVWKRLVNAGLIGALCDCVVKMGQVGVVHDPNAPRPSKEAMARIQEQLLSPWYYPLAVICSGLVNSATPPGATELRVVEDLKKHWNSMTERVWSDPHCSLEARATLERSLVGEIVIHILNDIDPSFMEVLMDKKDRTFAVCMRNWLYSEGTMDCYFNSNMLLPFLDQRSPFYTRPCWKAYLAKHPMPTAEVLLPRILEGASRPPEASAKKRSSEQTAAVIVAAGAKHLAFPESEFTMADLSLEVDLLRALVDQAAFPALQRAAYKSEPLWEGAVRAMRRAALALKRKEKGYETMNVVMRVLSWCAIASKQVQEEGAKTVDKLIYAWVNAGLLDALEESLDFYVDQTSGGFSLVVILHELRESLPKLSAKTTTALRAQFPRPHLVAQLKKAVGYAEGDPMLIYAREVMKMDAGEQSVAAPSGLWKHGALETVEVLTALLGSGQCARRGCAEPATGPFCQLERCKGTRYCSTACMEGDWAQHWKVCCDGEVKRTIEHDNANILERNRGARTRTQLCGALTVAVPVLAYAAFTYLRSSV